MFIHFIKGFKYSLSKNIYILVLLLFLSNCSNAQRIDSITVSAIICFVIPSHNNLVLDSLKWQELKPLINNYEGKKIKKILYQSYTDRLVVFVKGDDLAEMNLQNAIQYGLVDKIKPKSDDLNENPTKKKEEIFPFTQVNIDSPLYVGIDNPIKLKDIHLNDFFVTTWGREIKKSTKKNEYLVSFAVPGRYSLILHSKKTGRAAYQFNYTVKRLPEDELIWEPSLTIGYIDNQTTDWESLTRETEIMISDGFTFESATVYFAGESFKNLMIQDITTPALSQLNTLIQRCTEGCTITFDNVKVKDRSGKPYTIAGTTYYINKK
ncbi:hypothetical protein ACQ33O_07745 [Ferruginibacter sp. SUN002]|uniref:hypothetical protein n=1 Tax=Ferruginibacter sp. SUN002 TaxID=2937789 RepID=UPI003D35F701